MDIDLALLADAATVDPAGKLNILGIFDRISAGSFPVRHGHMALVLRFVAAPAEAGTHDVSIVVKGPEGEEVATLNGKIQTGPGSPVSKEKTRVPQVVNLGGMVFPGPGRYAFEVSVEGDHVVSVPLTLHEARGQGGPPPPREGGGGGSMGFGGGGGPVEA